MRRANPLVNPLRIAVIMLNIIWAVKGNDLTLKTQLLVPIVSVILWALTVFWQMRPLTAAGRARCIRRHLYLLLGYYAVMIAILLVFGGLFHVDRSWGGSVNLDLFHTVRSYWILYRRTGNFESVSNLLGNVIVFLPLGVLLPLTFPSMRRFWVALPLILLTIIGVEGLQYIRQSGSADVDDVLVNFIGAWAGYAVTRVVQMIMKRG